MASTARAILAVTSLSLCVASESFVHGRGSLCFSGLTLKSFDSRLFPHSCDVQKPSTSVLRMSEEGKPSTVQTFFKNQAKNIAGIVIAGISTFSAPRFVSAAQSHYNSNDPVIVLPSQDAYAQHAAIINDKDYENPVVRIAKDKRVWAGIGACGVGAGGFYLYQASEKKKAEQVIFLSPLIQYHIEMNVPRRTEYFAHWLGSTICSLLHSPSVPFDILSRSFLFADAIVAVWDDGPQRGRLHPRRGANQPPRRKDLRVQERPPVRHLQVRGRSRIGQESVFSLMLNRAGLLLAS
jgi:hypothetical protein